MDNDVAAVELDAPGSRVIPRTDDEKARLRARERQRRAEAGRVAALVRSMLRDRAEPAD